jgi:hypothetical protein
MPFETERLRSEGRRNKMTLTDDLAFSTKEV